MAGHAAPAHRAEPEPAGPVPTATTAAATCPAPATPRRPPRPRPDRSSGPRAARTRAPASSPGERRGSRGDPPERTHRGDGAHRVTRAPHLPAWATAGRRGRSSRCSDVGSCLCRSGRPRRRSSGAPRGAARSGGPGDPGPRPAPAATPAARPSIRLTADRRAWDAVRPPSALREPRCARAWRPTGRRCRSVHGAARSRSGHRHASGRPAQAISPTRYAAIRAGLALAESDGDAQLLEVLLGSSRRARSRAPGRTRAPPPPTPAAPAR